MENLYPSACLYEQQQQQQQQQRSSTTTTTTSNIGPDRGGKKLKRIRFNRNELKALETVFLETQYPDAAVISALSSRMKIPMEKICTWFQNRRSRYRKESKNGHIELMRKQVFSSIDLHRQHKQVENPLENINNCHVLSPPSPSPSPSHQHHATSTTTMTSSIEFQDHISKQAVVNSNCMYQNLQIPTGLATCSNYNVNYNYPY